MKEEESKGVSPNKLEVAFGREFRGINNQVMLCVLLSFKTLLASMDLIISLGGLWGNIDSFVPFNSLAFENGVQEARGLGGYIEKTRV